MIGIDTNILLRFLIDDDPAQNAMARRFMSERTGDDPAYVSAIVLAETVWVLRRRLNYPLPRIVESICALLTVAELTVEHADELDILLADHDGSVADVVDYLVAWAGFDAGCQKTMTFDRKAARRVPGMELLA